MNKITRTGKGAIKAPPGLSGQDLKDWKKAGEPEIWPDPDPDLSPVPANPEILLISPEEATRANERAEKWPPKAVKRPPSRFCVAPEHSLYIKAFVHVGGSVLCVPGEMDRVTKQCNIENISVPRSILEKALLAMYGKSLINIIYESSI